MRCKSNENLFVIRCLRQSREALCYSYNWLNDRSFALWACVCVCACLLSNRKWHAADLFTNPQLCPPPFLRLSVSQSLSQTQSVPYLCSSPQLSILKPHAPPTETTVWILWRLKRPWSLFWKRYVDPDTFQDEFLGWSLVNTNEFQAAVTARAAALTTSN